MKKLLKLLLIICIISAMALTVVGCQTPPPPEEPSGGPSGSPSGSNPSGSNPSGSNPSTPPALTKSELATIYKEIAQSAWATLGYTDPTQSTPTPTSLSFVTDTPETNDPTTIKQLKSVLAGSAAVVNMIGEYFNNDNFVISDKPVSFAINEITVPGVPYTDVKISMKTKIDKDADMLYVEFYMTGKIGTEDYIEYDYSEIGYDFDGEDGVKSFQLITRRKMPGMANLMYGEERLQEDGKCFMTDEASPAFIAQVDELYNAYMTAKAQEIALTEGNFDAEFNNYLNITNRLMTQNNN